jgi:hypothetical protein
MHPKKLSIDGIVQRPAAKLAEASPPRHMPVAPLKPHTQPPLHRPSPPPKKSTRRLEMPLVIVSAIAAGILAQSIILGQLAIILYGFAAFIWSIASRFTFTLTLVSLLTTVILLAWGGNMNLAQAFASYTFLLLVVGVISLGRELKKEGGRIYSIRQQNKY